MFQPASAQTKDAPIAFANLDAIKTSFVAAPNLGVDVGSSSPSDAAQWLKVEFHYSTTANVTKDYPFVDAVQFKVWIEGFDLYAKDAPVAGKGVSIALTGDVTYVNVAMNRDLYGVFFVSPSVLARYSSERGTSDFDRKFNIHLESYVNGTLVDLIDKRKEQDPKWFAPLKVVSGMVYRQDQCPFLVSDTSHYPMIKPPAPGQ